MSSVRAALTAAVELWGRIESGPYDGLHGMPEGLTREEAREYRGIRRRLLTQRRLGRERQKPMTEAAILKWIGDYQKRASLVPYFVRADIARLVEFKRQHAEATRQAKAQRSRRNAQATKETKIGEAITMALKNRPELSPGDPTAIFHELLSQTGTGKDAVYTYFPGGLPYVGTGFKKYEALRAKIREDLKRRN